ncbi:hypothetical protein COCSUDRAFT_61633 [Coccomyxa subellipsoidea C-169]|uniref:Uncharacterized protein n=1 Tax=Coccomyxa subellipsoidea (strain C-169) TaxID=574566 RepID=I0Z445_COCSC|nr:hypothetical protein COCSUDRAFT_61633 [Coccomyxa subellipsoidea C-169]EIE25414.1 hypothetical protein COCSUDRAFT_61633 [Coccomyxa subellipsoidea C-169]|eukprot:XP_005649958.1 hypothetical protein COCSUDRAFT_61633 [Coccomyxa subellipsoidea C-169]
MVLYKGFRHERSKGDDGLRTNYWYLQRVDGSEDLAVIGREIKGSGGHYNYNSAPLFGMLSWVNSSEVRRWLQTKISDTNALRSAAAAATLPGQDALYSVPLQSHGSEGNLQLAQDLGIRTSNATGGSDLQWGTALLGPLVGAHSGEMGFIADKHQRNAVIGHTLGVIEGQLDLLRQRTGIEYTMTLVTQEKELHVLGSAAASVAVSSGVDNHGLTQGPDPNIEDDAPPPAWQLQTKRALTDLWNLSELEDSRKRMASGQHTLPLSVPLPSLPM